MKNSNRTKIDTSPLPIAMYKVIFIIKDGFSGKLIHKEFEQWPFPLPEKNDMVMIDDMRAGISNKTFKLNSENQDITVEYTCF